ncbi:MAG: hypothetical protein QOH96_2493 [Blastocatellia bacterium]|nr:hypothetical protein [Blastocatellia bacterium]
MKTVKLRRSSASAQCVQMNELFGLLSETTQGLSQKHEHAPAYVATASFAGGNDGNSLR